MALSGVLWDVGNVIVRWNPRTLYKQVFANQDRLDWFLSHVCTMDWHCEIDAGKSFDQAVAERCALFPEYAREIALWKTRFTDMISGPIAETQDVMAALEAAGVPQFGLTNMSAETWPPIREMAPGFVHLRDTVVSGAEGVIKPDPAIFHIACQRAGLPAEALLFVDDSLANIEAAVDLGFATHHFTDPAALRPAMQAHGLI